MRKIKYLHRQDRKSLGACLREIFTNGAWMKLHRRCREFERQRSRWSVQPLLVTGISALLSRPGSWRDRFEEGREFCSALLPKRRRGGSTAEGFLKALAHFPLEGMEVMRERIQEYVLERGIKPAQMGRHVVFGLDGSKQNLPRTEANIKRYGGGTKEPPLPQRLTVAAVAMGRRMLWDWECGAGTDSERGLALKISKRLPRGCLQVVDAGFVGYEWCCQALEDERHVLMRVGSNVRLLVEAGWKVEERGGWVWLWPKASQAEGDAPIKLRLIKLERMRKGRRRKKGKAKGQKEVMWLMTDLPESRLTREEARQIYHRRYGGNEITFRSWKCTLESATQLSRTPTLAEREGSLSLFALMLLQAMTLLARKRHRKKARVVSVAQAQRLWRKAARAQTQQKSTTWFREALSAAVVDNYKRKAPKVKRIWPKRKGHRLPGTPIFLKLKPHIKRLGVERLCETGT